jgi:hypothetical protein
MQAETSRTANQPTKIIMDRNQLNHTGMGSTVSAYMETNKTIWNSVKTVDDTMDDVNDSIADINSSAGKQQTPTTGAADAKAQVRHNYEEQILWIADQLAALAEVKGDANLAGKVELTLSSLDKLSDDELEETGTRIAGLATTSLAALADYGIAQADLTALTALTAQFHAAKTSPRTAVAERAGQTTTLPDKIAGLMSIFRNRLDKLMTRFKKSHPEFYAGYLSARVIVDRGGAPAAAKPAPAPAPTPA